MKLCMITGKLEVVDMPEEKLGSLVKRTGYMICYSSV